MDGLILGIDHNAVHLLLGMFEFEFGSLSYTDAFLKIITIDNFICQVRNEKRESEQAQQRMSSGGGPNSSMTIKRL